MNDKYKQLVPLNLPTFNIKIKKNGDQLLVWDPTRKKQIVLTPEEWVRQHFVNYLVAQKGYSQSLIANEVAIKLNGTLKRCDTVVYDQQLVPLAIVEYKAPHITISPAVFDQIARYNMVLRVPYLIVSNGLRHFCCRIDYEANNYHFLREIPNADEIGQRSHGPSTTP